MATALTEALKTPQSLIDACLYCRLKRCNESAQGCLFRQVKPFTALEKEVVRESQLAERRVENRQYYVNKALGGIDTPPKHSEKRRAQWRESKRRRKNGRQI